MKRVKVMTVVVAYNAYKGAFFPRCLEALQAISLSDAHYDIDHQIVVVDNASSDQTYDRVRKAFPYIETVFSADNLGYAGGNNLGMERALSRQADYVAVVTQDVTVDPDWLLHAVAAAETDGRIGVVQPLLLLWPDQSKVNSVGNAIHFLGYGYAGGYGLPRSAVADRGVRDIPYASGAVILLKARALRDVGLFDDEMWMYNEDQDLGWRMNLAGYRNVLAPQSTACHQYEFSRSISKIYFMDRNRLLVILQNYHWGTLLLLAPWLLANELATFVLALVGGWGKEKLRVWRYFLRRPSWRQLSAKRRQRQKNRIVPDRVILARFTGKILFQDIQSPIVTRFANPVLGFAWAVLRRLIIW
ncbi:MAG: glycosyltransferase family 2 protein [Parcubacteria group bacterium]|nr:glycosyltransferase family 2 protein [Parcubacteria group bacterium]